MSIEASCKPIIMTLRDPTSVWKRLNQTFHAVSKASIDDKLTKFQSIKMKQSESVMEYANRTQNILDDLTAAGQFISDLEKKRGLLRGLWYDYSIVAQIFRDN